MAATTTLPAATAMTIGTTAITLAAAATMPTAAALALATTTLALVAATMPTAAALALATTTLALVAATMPTAAALALPTTTLALVAATMPTAAALALPTTTTLALATAASTLATGALSLATILTRRLSPSARTVGCGQHNKILHGDCCRKLPAGLHDRRSPRYGSHPIPARKERRTDSSHRGACRVQRQRGTRLYFGEDAGGSGNGQRAPGICTGERPLELPKLGVCQRRNPSN